MNLKMYNNISVIYTCIYHTLGNERFLVFSLFFVKRFSMNKGEKYLNIGITIHYS